MNRFITFTLMRFGMHPARAGYTALKIQMILAAALVSILMVVLGKLTGYVGS